MNKSFLSGSKSVVPFTMESMSMDVKLSHLLISHLYAGLISALIRLGEDAQAFSGCGVGNQIDNDLAAYKGPSPPVLRKVSEHPVLDPVPLACPWGEVTDCDGKTRFIGKFLQFKLPKPGSAPVASPTVGSDEKFRGIRISAFPILSHHLLRVSTANSEVS